ncbi:MAG: protein kinase [Candidatus Obscuribacterales bacterium]|nr:protein kinase [Candidatus Obscuribacterales bacterium]
MPDNHSDNSTDLVASAASKAYPEDFPDIDSGRYVFEKIVGAGGCGTVYRAYDNKLDKTVAIKKLHDSANEMQAIRFQREARLVGLLNHLNVLSALDYGMTSRNEPYLILDFVSGESLAAVLRRTGPLPIDSALDLLIQLCSGFAHAHRKNVIHRDIKPSNVMLVRDSIDQKTVIAKVVDFGLAKNIDDDRQHLTMTGLGLGTPKYMSPEQVIGIEADKRSDIYSFGCLIFEVLSGQVPFLGETAIDTVEMHRQLPPPTLASMGVRCSENMERIVAVCLKKDPTERYQSFETLKQQLEAEQESRKSEKSSTSTTIADYSYPIDETTSVRPTQNPRSLTIPFAIGGIMIGAIFVAMIWVWWKPSQPLKKPAAIDPLIVNPISLESGNSIFPAGTVGICRDDVRQTASYVCDGVTDKELKSFVKKYGEIDQVILMRNSLTRKGFALLDRAGVKAIVIVEPVISDELFARLSPIKTLRALSLEDPQKVDANALTMLGSVSTLEQLELSRLKLDDSAITSICELMGLKHLNLHGCNGLTRDRIAKLVSLPKLTTLKLEQTDITDGALEPVINSKLECLEVCNTGITDSIIRKVDMMPRLGILDVRSTKVTPQTVAILQSKRDPKKGRLYVFSGPIPKAEMSAEDLPFGVISDGPDLKGNEEDQRNKLNVIRNEPK